MAGWKKRVYCIDPDKSYTPTARITSDGITEFPQYQPINLIPLKSGKLFVLTNGRAILLDLETGRGLKSVPPAPRMRNAWTSRTHKFPMTVLFWP